MLVRESTHRFSSLMAHRNMVSRVLPLTSALAEAFLAFSSRAVRAALLPCVNDDRARRDLAPWRANAAEAHFRAIRQRGYAVVTSSQEPGIGAVAAPILHASHVAACINVVLPDHMVEGAVMREPIARRLVATARTIEQDVRTRHALDAE